MKTNHNDHWENILLYGECECGVNENSLKTLKQLIEDLEKKKLEKLLQEYPELRGDYKPISEEYAQTPI